MPARSQTIAAADAQLKASQAALDRAVWALGKRQLTAPADGTVYDLIRLEGEIAGPTQPVLSFLPDGAVKLRLYVPATGTASIATGSVLEVRCDGCPAGLSATVTYVSDAPEFTPPVIYSLENR
ncbi:MAG: HlyD family efflux transporter periplasmic adaptor subunit, partial [Deltaproteobacteria bacterium]